ncbi:GHMP family kinase ATP-binding protein (plasmid) [Rhizobium leguminosarum]
MTKSVPVVFPKSGLIVSKTPLRVSFLGGGSDIPAFYHRFPGAVVSAAIDKFVYVTAKARADRRIRLVTHAEHVYDAWEDVPDPIHRAVFDHLGWEIGADVSIMSDVTAQGSGLGASSAVVVGLLHALGRLRDRVSMPPEELAAQAAHVEMNIAKRDIGKQDAYPPAFGDLRHYKFHSNEIVEARELNISSDVKQELSSWLTLLDSGCRRDASTVLSSQKALLSHAEREAIIVRMVQHASCLALDLEKGILENLKDYFEEAWHLKERLGALIGHPEFGEIYRVAKECGALGAKVLGAGGGGYFLFLAPPLAQNRLREAFGENSLHKITICDAGSTASLIK